MRSHLQRVALVSLAVLGACSGPPALGEFVYVKADGENFDIMRSSVADPTRIRIAGHPALDFRPGWTPDGARIVFCSDRRWRYDLDIFVTDSLGERVSNLTPLSGEELNPAVSPQGLIAFVSDRDFDRDIYSMDMTGGSVRRLTDNEDVQDDFPAWSADGRQLAYVSDLDGDIDIRVLDVATLENRRLVERPGIDGVPTWSPDGRFIAFNGTTGDTVSIWVVGVDGSGLRRIPNVHPDERHPAWSPDGEWILYTASTAAGGQLESDLWIMRPDGTDRRQVTNEPGREEMGSWRPGTRVPAASAGSGVVSVEPADRGPAVVLDWQAIAEKLVERMQIEDGERVLLVARPNRFRPLIEPLRAAVRAAGGVDLGAMSVTDEPLVADTTQFLRWVATATDRTDLTALFSENVDVGVMFPAAHATDAYAAMQDVLRTGRGRTVHFHWDGAFEPDGTEIPVVSGESGTVSRDAIDAQYQHALLATDYEVLAATQREFERAARGSEVRVTTPAGTDLRFRIGERPVTKQDGDASAARASQARNLIDREIELPAGAIRVAPIEESVNGTIAFPPGTWFGQTVEGLVMQFENGRLVDWTAGTGAEAVLAELEQAGDPASRFREFALGFNPLLASNTRPDWIPYYGYGAGVVRLSLGDNTELGGAVGGGYIRWNFFRDATVTAGSETWVENGRLIK